MLKVRNPQGVSHKLPHLSLYSSLFLRNLIHLAFAFPYKHRSPGQYHVLPGFTLRVSNLFHLLLLIRIFLKRTSHHVLKLFDGWLNLALWVKWILTTELNELFLTSLVSFIEYHSPTRSPCFNIFSSFQLHEHITLFTSLGLPYRIFSPPVSCSLLTFSEYG